MATTNGTSVHKSWEELLDARINLYKQSAESSGNTLDMIKVADQLNDINYHGSFMKKAGRHRNVTAVLHSFTELENRTLRGNEEVEEQFKKCNQRMEKFQNTPDGQDKRSWETELDKIIDEQIVISNKHWEQLRVDGRSIISKMPEDMRDSAARMYGGALGAIADFYRKGVDWLKGALQSVLEWLKKAWEKIKELARQVGNWFVGAWNAIKKVFGGKESSVRTFTDWYRVNWPVGDDSWKETEDWVRRRLHITHYRFYKQTRPSAFTFELGVQVTETGWGRTYEFGTPEPDIYSLTVFTDGQHNVNLNDDSGDPRVMQIRVQEDD